MNFGYIPPFALLFTPDQVGRVDQKTIKNKAKELCKYKYFIANIEKKNVFAFLSRAW